MHGRIQRGKLSLADRHQELVLLLHVAGTDTDVDGHVVTIAPFLRVVLHEAAVKPEGQLLHAVIAQGLEYPTEHWSYQRFGHHARHDLDALLRRIHDRSRARRRLVQRVTVQPLAVPRPASSILFGRLQ